MKRITVEQVVKAFEQTGIQPKQGDYFQCDGEQFCACGLGVVYVADHNIEEFTQNSLKTAVINKYFDLNYSTDYRCGFARGFDNLINDFSYDDDPAEYIAGYEDGVAARKAVLKEE